MKKILLKFLTLVIAFTQCVVTSNLVVMNDSWWGKWEYRAFNVAYADKRALAASNPRNNPDQSTLCEDLKKGFAIYLPKK